MPTAIVFGATGIIGSEIVNALGSQPQTWTKVYAVSRTQKAKYPPTIVHSTLDLQADAESLAKQLDGIEADYIFFAAFLAAGSEYDDVKVNGSMLQSLLDALTMTGIDRKFKRFILTCGGKQYGQHFGRPKNPMQESDPWLEADDWPPNFYYDQQRILANAAKGKSWDWVVTYPGGVIGFARGNFMNMCTAIGLYAVVSAALPGSELPYPGNPEFYLRFNCWTSSKLHARFCLWASQEKSAGNQAFNVVNGDAESWQNLWPKVARYFGTKLPATMFEGERYKDFESGEMEITRRPPIDGVAEEMGMKNAFAPTGRIEQRIDLFKWARRSDVMAAYKKIQKEHRLEKDAWEKATWGFLSWALGARNYDCVVSMSKGRKYGWTGYQDTWESMVQTFEKLEEERILPRRQM